MQFMFRTALNKWHMKMNNLFPMPISCLSTSVSLFYYLLYFFLILVHHSSHTLCCSGWFDRWLVNARFFLVCANRVIYNLPVFNWQIHFHMRPNDRPTDWCGPFLWTVSLFYCQLKWTQCHILRTYNVVIIHILKWTHTHTLAQPSILRFECIRRSGLHQLDWNRVKSFFGVAVNHAKCNWLHRTNGDCCWLYSGYTVSHRVVSRQQSQTCTEHTHLSCVRHSIWCDDAFDNATLRFNHLAFNHTREMLQVLEIEFLFGISIFWHFLYFFVYFRPSFRCVFRSSIMLRGVFGAEALNWIELKFARASMSGSWSI